MTVSLSSDEIHVWWHPLVGGPSDPRDRRRFASERGRALVRRVLSRYVSVAEEPWKRQRLRMRSHAC